VPLVVRDQVTGVVYVDNRIKNALFGEKQRTLLVDFANQAATAIENARLFERMQAALNEITEMKELMDNVFASIASGVITTDVHDMGNDVQYGQPNGFSMCLTSTCSLSFCRDPARSVFRCKRPDRTPSASAVPRRSSRSSRRFLSGEVNLNLKLSPLKKSG